MHQSSAVSLSPAEPRLQLIVSLSSYEEECISAALSTCQEIWLKNMIKEISSENCDVVTMKIDNVSAIQLEKNPIAHSRRNLPYKVGLHGKPIATALRK
ncbi:Gag-Pol polyprotein/retrotransposon, putative [Medicago truncatula]|uniref:Gag-Pol polyprotein/retrotransposon, putative n=1 Tax=Medicago truncatula TaxID=3880 RepID=A0A072UK98_MEDTR|nr:Gag-Pol polyprotein/retrotransposon, putative [Medicago truncatula]